MRATTRRRVLLGSLLALVVLLLSIFFTRIAPVATNYAAKIACSSVFVSGRALAEVEAEDLASVWYVDVEVDPERQIARANLLWLARATAVFRVGQGCTLIHAHTVESLKSQALFPASERTPRPFELIDGYEPTLTSSLGIDRIGLERVLREAFAEADEERPRRTRAVVVLYKGYLVAEGYRVGFGPDTPLLGWSMTKSVLATMFGRAAQLGWLPDLDTPVPAAVWAEDERRQITWRQMLWMSSGLEFDETYGMLADATDMLFLSEDTGAYAMAKPLEHPPGAVLSYSSGTSNALSRLLRRQLGDARYHRLPYREVFDRLGIDRATIEPDASGTYVASSFMYAPARAWAKLGQLYLQDGVWRGERLLAEGWVEFVRTPAPAAQQREYGAHFWLNRGPEAHPERRELPSVPPDAYRMSGFEGQAVVIVPSYEAVIVRLGQTPAGGAWDLNAFVARILAALPDPKEPGRSSPFAGTSGSEPRPR